MKSLRVATCQFSVEADIAHNHRFVLRQLEQAAAAGAERVPGLADSPGALLPSPQGLQDPSPEGDRNKAPGESASPGTFSPSPGDAN